MAKYLLIESRDPFDAGDVTFYYDLARRLAQQGDAVTLFLVQNGVLAARAGARAHGLSELAAAGVDIFADDFSLRERGIASGQLLSGVKPSPLDIVVDQLVDGCKVMWH